MSALAAYNVSLSSNSPFFVYHPNRDGDPTLTWNSSYTASHVWPPIANQNEPAGVPYRRTQSTSAGMTFDYLGSNIYLCFAGDASYSVTIDNIPITSTHLGSDPVCANYEQATTMIYSSGLKQGNHAVTLTVDSASSDKELRFFGGTITLGITSGSTQVRERQIDDLDPGWHLVPGRGDTTMWLSGEDIPAHNMINNTHSWTCLYDQANQRSATYSFSGAGGVVLRGPIGMGLQVFSIDFDEQRVPLDATSVWPDTNSVALFMRGGLDPKKQYTITLRNFNENYPAPDQNYYMPSSQPLLAKCANLDGLVLLGDGAGSAPPHSTPSTGGTTVPAPQSPPVPTTTTASESASATVPGSGGQDPGAPGTTGSEPTSSSLSSSASAGDDSGQNSLHPQAVPSHKKLSTGAIVGICFGIAVSVIATVCGAFAIFIKMFKARERTRMSDVHPLPQQDDPFASNYAIPSPPASHNLVPTHRTGKLHALVDATGLSKPPIPSTPSVSMGADSMEPSEVMSATETTSVSTRVRRGRMAPEDLEEVLAFVAQRMDREQDRRPVSDSGNGGNTLPPDYRD